MFSANENIKLRQHKRRIVQYVEECIPENVLDAGTTVMAMQITCTDPGCVPLETALAIVFPRLLESGSSEPKQIMKGVKESKGGTFKVKVLLPMSEVTKEDILDALPPEFIGGRRTMQKICIKIRDSMFGQISQLMGEDDKDGRGLLAAFLMEEMKEYVASECISPPIGEPFPKSSVDVEIKDPSPSKQETSTENNQDKKSDETVKKMMQGGGNIVIRRPMEDDNQLHFNGSSNNQESSASSQTLKTTATPKKKFSAGKAQMQKIDANLQTSVNIMRKLVERDHPPGIRRSGCPCCDPDSISGAIDQMFF